MITTVPSRCSDLVSTLQKVRVSLLVFVNDLAVIKVTPQLVHDIIDLSDTSPGELGRNPSPGPTVSARTPQFDCHQPCGDGTRFSLGEY